MNEELVREFERKIPARLSAGNVCLKCGRVMTGNAESDGSHATDCLLRSPDAEEFATAVSGNPRMYTILLEEIAKAGLLDVVTGGKA